MTQLNCTTPGCNGFYEIHKYTRNLKQLLGLCKPCQKEYTKAYQRNWYAEHCKGKPQKKRGGYRPRKVQPVPETKNPKLNRDGKPIKYCKKCGGNAYPNYYRCPACHNARSRFMSGLDEHTMPHVPMTR